MKKSDEPLKFEIKVCEYNSNFKLILEFSSYLIISPESVLILLWKVSNT